MRKDRVKQLERKLGARDVPDFVMCWCAYRADGGHDEDCPVLKIPPDEIDQVINLTWDIMVEGGPDEDQD